jgi:hypothetical protein
MVARCVSSVERSTDVHHITILRLLVLVGEECAAYNGTA